MEIDWDNLDSTKLRGLIISQLFLDQHPGELSERINQVTEQRNTYLRELGIGLGAWKDKWEEVKQYYT